MRDMVARNKKYSSMKLKHVLKQIVTGTAYLHENKVMHRDIKPSNLMIDKEWNVFITDYGISKLIEENDSNKDSAMTHTAIGTPLFTAPEVWDNH